MSINEDKKNKIRKFYSDEILQHVCHVSDSFNEFMKDSQIGCLRIRWDWEEGGLLEPHIRRLTSDMPDNLARTFERHLWYSRHNLTDISVLKKSVDDDETFLMLLQGHCNDGWDNGCRLIELFDYQGESLGSGFFRVGGWDGGVLQQWIDWVDRQLNGNDYFMSAPPYPDDSELNEEQANVLRRYELIWSEDGSYPVSFE
jgi:hypothetical protein